MDEYENKIIILANRLTKKECGNIKSIIGVMDLLNTLTEEITKREKGKKFSYEFKKELSIKSLLTVSSILYKKDLISPELHKYIKETIESKNTIIFIEFLEDIQELWLQNINKHCLCFVKNDNKKKLKKFKKLV